MRARAFYMCLTALLSAIGSARGQTEPVCLVQCGEKQAESECLAAAGRVAERKGDTLTLGFADGKKATLKSNEKACARDDADHCAKYVLTAYLCEPKLIFVEARGYESRHYVVYSQTTGAKVDIQGDPKFSPDHRRIIVAEEGSGDQAFVIWNLSKDPVQKEYYHDFYADESEVEQGTWQLVGWMDSERLKFRYEGQADQQIVWGRKPRYAAGDYYLRFLDGKWSLSGKPK